MLAGALIGLGVAAKLYPLLLLAPLAVLAAAHRPAARGRSRPPWLPLCAWLVVNLPIMVLFPRGWSEFFRLNTRRGDDMDSLYNVVKSFTGWPGFDPDLGFWQPPTVLNTVSAMLFVSCCAAIAYIALTAPRRPRLAQLAFLVVAAFLLTNKVWSPQFSLWLVPLAVLALPHRRILLAWMTIDALVWVPRMLYLYGEPEPGLPEQWFTITVLLRDIAVIALCALVIRQIYRPELDLVRARDTVDDPAGGVFDRAPDAPPRWLPDWLRPSNDRVQVTPLYPPPRVGKLTRNRTKPVIFPTLDEHPSRPSRRRACLKVVERGAERASKSPSVGKLTRKSAETRHSSDSRWNGWTPPLRHRAA